MINDMAKSVMNFSWAMSLFGVRQMANFLLPEESNQPMSKVTDAFDAITEVTENQLGNTLKEAFKAGEQLQSGMTEMSSPFFRPDRFDPSQIMQVPMEMMNRMASAFAQSKRGDTSRSYYGGWDAV